MQTYTVTEPDGTSHTIHAGHAYAEPTTHALYLEDEAAEVVVAVFAPGAWASVTLEQDVTELPKVTTEDELDALPTGTVLLDREGMALQKHRIVGWSAINGTRSVPPSLVVSDGAPLTVIHTPEG